MAVAASLLTIIAALVLVLEPVGALGTFYAVGAIFLGLVAAGALRPRAGLHGAAALLGWFALVIVQPFSITRQQLNALRREAKAGNAEAEALIAFYEGLEPYAFWIMLALSLVLVAVYAWGLRRARKGTFDFLLDESARLAAFCQRIGIAAALLFAPMMIIIVYDVVQRKYLGWDPSFTDTAWYRTFTSTKLQEMQWHLHAVLFLMCFGYAYVKDAHVRIELVRDTLRARTRVWVELLGTLLFMLPYCFVVIEYGIDNAMRSFEMGERSSAQTGLEYRFVIKAFLPLGFVMLAMAALSVAQKCVVFLFGPERLRPAAGAFAASQHGAPAPAAN